MIVAVHGLKTDLPGDLAMAHDRIRAATMAAEDVLHDLGVIPIMSSDAQGMGRAGETVARTFATAAVMKQRIAATGESDDLVSAGGDDNARVLRYLAKLTVNPAVAHGLAHEIGTLEPGKLADIVLWNPAWFGVKPVLVLKAGFPALGRHRRPERHHRHRRTPGLRAAVRRPRRRPADLSVAFVSRACLDSGNDQLPTRRRRVTVHGCRGIGLVDMVRNTRTGTVEVDHSSAAVSFDGIHLHAEPTERTSLSRLYLM